MFLQSASFLLLVLAAPDALPYEFRNFRCASKLTNHLSLLKLTFIFTIENRAKVDEACTALGGKCLDWRYNKCTAGYVAGKCSGDSNMKCCLPCDTTCK